MPIFYSKCPCGEGYLNFTHNPRAICPICRKKTDPALREDLDRVGMTDEYLKQESERVLKALEEGRTVPTPAFRPYGVKAKMKFGKEILKPTENDWNGL